MNWSNIKNKNNIDLIAGITLVIIGILMPLILNVENFKIYPGLFLSIENQSVTLLVYAALKLATLNTLRSLPHYLGAFFIRDSFNTRNSVKRHSIIGTIMVCVIIPLVYVLIDKIYGIKYDFGVSAMLIITMIIMFEKADFSFVNLTKKALMMTTLIASMQFLDVMPRIAFLSFGRGETSKDIKAIALFLNAENFLQCIATLLFVLLFFSSVLLCKMIVDENKLRLLVEEKKAAQKALTEERIRAMKERTQLELQHLVHDLKTPITTAQALTTVIKLGSERDGQLQNVEYLSKVEAALEHMSAMVSEILYETKRSLITTHMIVELLLAQISNADYSRLLATNNAAPNAKVELNEIRFIRALVNLIENSYHSLTIEKGVIKLNIYEIDKNVVFEVADKGIGIYKHNIDKVWEQGYTTNGSSGLGLSFVESVVKTNLGTINIDSEENKGTAVRIVLPQISEEQ